MKCSSFAAAVIGACMASAAPLELAKRTYTGGLVANDVTEGICAPYTLIFARGSTEISNMGETVGPELAKALIAAYGAGKVAVQGVDYPATILSNVSFGSEGGPEMATLIKKVQSSCPSSQIILSGYSQGSTVTHWAVKNGGVDVSKIGAVVLYGDPELGAAVGTLPSSKLKEFCALGDGVCELHTFDITAAHLSYGINGDIGQGVSFIKSVLGSSTTSSASSSSSSAAA